MPARFPDTSLPASTMSDIPDPAVPGTCKLLAVKPGRDIWAIGSSFILKSKAHYPGCEVEVQNVHFAREQTTIPIPAFLAHWQEGGRVLAIQERVEGEPLEDIVSDLRQEDLARIGKELGAYLSQLRELSNPSMTMLDGRMVIDRRLLKPLSRAPSCGNADDMILSDEQVAEVLALRIKGHLDGRTLDSLMGRMPSAKPFVFSHSDLHEGNIMVKDGHFVGLIDWELAGYYPEWWEFVNSCESLSYHLPAELHRPAALRWFEVYHAVRDRPHEEATHTKLRAYLGV
jgi:aminoglycoside phosphotransferase